MCFPYVFDIYSKCARVVSLKDNKGIVITNAFQNVLNGSEYKPNKIWVDKDSQFYNRSRKSWLQDNDIQMYSRHDEGNPMVAERFIRTLKIKVYKYMTLISKNVYIDKLNDMIVYSN